ncbi:MAG: Ig-like domain-containing protein [Lachnospiraceae bacterium]
MKNKQFLTKLASVMLAAALTTTGVPMMVYAEPVQAVMEQTADQQPAAENTQYVLMNVPYADFYQSELTGNDKIVDSVSSATLNKTRNIGLVAGSYHVDPKGSDISGVTIPVKLGAGVTFADLSTYSEITDDSSVPITMASKTGETTTEYKGKDALFEAPNYAYYKLTQAPAYYKEMTIQDGKLQFGPMQGQTPEVVENTSVQLLTSTRYGDYQLNVTGFDISDTIYGVTVSTKEGTSYGLRHLENLWKSGTQLAWSTGFVTSVNNCPLQAAHYESMMGKTIQKLTYYTSGGIYEINTGDIYVPVKFANAEFKVEDADQTKGSTTITTTGFPSDYAPEYSVAGLDGAKVENGVLTFEAAKPGSYTATVKDKNGKYTDVSTTFTVSTENTPVQFNAKGNKLTSAEGYDETAASDYIANISKVAVNGKEYAATGKGAVALINADGTLKTDAQPFAQEAQGYNIVVTATGYKNNLTFTYNKNQADGAEAAKLLEDVKGTYSNLFQGGLFESKYDQYWYDATAAVIGDSNVEETVEMMKNSVGADTYGAQAQKEAFCCKFIDGVKNIIFNGTQVKAEMEDGSEITHTYHFLKKATFGEMGEVYLYESDDATEDVLRYILLCPDTPANTYHIEFRYGNSLEDLLKLQEGSYANWLAAGIPIEALTEKNNALVQNCIALFCTENLQEMTTDLTKKQWSSIAGIWDADMSAYANVEEYKNAKMYCELKEDGTGATYVDMQESGSYVKAHDFTFYVYDNDGKAETNAGVYIAVDGIDGKTEKATYVLQTQDGKSVLTFETLDGEKLSYIKRQAEEKKTTIALKKSSATIYVKGTTQISATVKNAKGATQYKSDKPSVATVNSKGKVTAKKTGTAKITVTNNGVKKVFTVKVKNPTLNKTNVTLKAGKAFTLKVNGKIGTPKFTSTKTAVAKVTKNGNITAVKKGSAVIKVNTNGLTLKCKVTVK